MPTTSNFGWTTPADTDLVKDGAAAIRTLGNGIDTSFVDLKGGTTGQVLSKNSNTDLDFTWVTSDDANAIQNAIVDAKGDLIAASAADTPARLAVGNNGETLVADSSTSTGLRWQGNMVGGKNAVINGAFDIWQRGTSLTTASSYTADRWFRGTSTAVTVSRQVTGDTTNLPFIQYCARVQRNSGSTSTAQIDIGSPLESATCIPYAGKQIVVSFYARAGANFSSTSSNLGLTLWTGTGTDQNVFSSYTGAATPIATSFALTTTWQRFSASITLGSTVTEFTPVFYYAPTGTAGANDYFEITGVQIEVGSVPTQFSRAGGTLAGERSACMRYYQRFNSDQVYAIYASGPARSTTQADFLVPFLVPLRTSPSSSIDYANLGMNAYNGDTTRTVTALVENGVNKSPFAAVVTATHAGTNFTQGNIYRLFNDNNASGYLGFSAEL